MWSTMEELHAERKTAMGALVALLATGMTPKPCITRLTELMETGATPDAVEFAERAEAATLASPFVDHEGIFTQLDIIYETVAHEKKAQRKAAYKKFNAVAEDKKAEPAHLEEVRRSKVLRARSSQCCPLAPGW